MHPSGQLIDDAEITGGTEGLEEKEGGSEYDDEAEEDEGADAEAEEIASRLRDQLWADINKAQADRAGTISEPQAVSTSVQDPISNSQKGQEPLANQPSPHNISKQEEAAIATIRAILSYATKDAEVLAVISSTVVPECNSQNVLDVFNRIILNGTISKEIAKPLSNLCLSLARSETLFSKLRQPVAQPDKGKRKRDEIDETHHSSDPRHSKRPLLHAPGDLQSQIMAAVRLITGTLSANPSHGAMNAALISSIQLQLHQIFLFAVTSSAGGGPEMNALQEISGLIQVIGVLSGIQIGSTPPGAHHDPQSISLTPNQFASNNNPGTPWLPPAPPLPLSGPSTDIGTAVYPCLIPSCRKVFSRLYSLRAHQRMHAIHRPFRCNSCPASFARNHDLKRHTKLHDKRAWKCCGCNKMFSRRDAIKRHKKSNKARGSKGDVCLNAEVIEVDLANQGMDESLREGRRAKIWTGITGGPSGLGEYCDDKNLEEGEVESQVIDGAQAAVLSLHGLLQSHVASILGIPPGNSSPEVDPSAGQATLASIIARAQWQNLPLKWPLRPKQGGTHPPATTAASDEIRPAHSLPSQQTSGPDGPEQASTETPAAGTASLSRYGLSEEQTKLLEQAIANAASAAQAQAEAEAALEEEDEEEGDVFDEDDEDLMNGDGDDDDDGGEPT